MEENIVYDTWNDEVIGFLIIIKENQDLTNSLLAVIVGFLFAYSFFAFVFMRRK